MFALVVKGSELVKLISRSHLKVILYNKKFFTKPTFQDLILEPADGRFKTKTI